MAKHEIEVTINLDGIVESEVLGIVGSACEDECKWIDALGSLLEHKKTKDAGKTRKVALVKKVYQ